MVGAAVEETGHLVELLVVVLAGHEPGAGRRAKIQVIVETGPSERELGVLAAAVRDHTPDRFQGGAQRDRMCVRSPVAGAVGPGTANQGDAREVLIERQLDVQVVLVIAQSDIEPRPVPLDHGLLEHERLLLGRGRDHLELVDARDHGGDVLRQHARGLEVIRHAVAQAQRLTHVDDARLDVAHQVDARGVGQRLETLF